MNGRISFTPITKPTAEPKPASVSTPVIQTENASRNLLRVESANRTMKLASSKPIPKKLCGSLWHEGELCILVADTNVGKSIFAVQAGNNITSSKPQRFLGCEAEKQPILYFDFELSDKQFQRRYSCQSFSGTEMLYEFADGFYRISIDPDFAEVFDFDAVLMAEIERAVLETGAKILIIDNLTFLKTQAVDTAKEALPLMQKLKSLKTPIGIIYAGACPHSQAQLYESHFQKRYRWKQAPGKLRRQHLRHRRKQPGQKHPLHQADQSQRNGD